MDQALMWSSFDGWSFAAGLVTAVLIINTGFWLSWRSMPRRHQREVDELCLRHQEQDQ
jgi:hypothetical protein